MKPCLNDFEHNLTILWNESNCKVVWTIFTIAFCLNWIENWPFPVLWPWLSFPYLLAYWVQHFEQHDIFKTWNSSTGIPSTPLTLFVKMLPKAHLTSHSRISGSRWVITSSWLSQSLRPLLHSFSVYSCHLFLISSALLGPYHLCPLLCPSLQKIPLNISSFPEEISNLCHSTIFLYLFALLT